MTTKPSTQRIQAAFQNKAFIPFITCGDPDLATTEQVVDGLIAAGASLVELGIPFSDPVAEGETIQAADERALSKAIKLDQIFELVRRIRQKHETPLVFMTYANPIFAYGTDRFMAQAADAGIDGIIIPDAPYEEKGLFQTACDQHGITLISMVAPSSQERIQSIAGDAEGFLYLVSSLGVTGVRQNIQTDIPSIVQSIRQATDIPVAVGFGIATPDQAREMSQASDGAIIGSAIVKLIAKHGTDSAPVVEAYAREIVQAIQE
ncbi:MULTISPECIES: tryptophan synthase subunit alpha [Aerococcus]|uniref:Tryptophan synthase alpha chain n=1 Tax=Aerococcus sanguinicola TaxID=119206 RepID=A0A5N1GGV5_9LACT|nr:MULTISPECIES: tryptophan synthase subunit alpha [Aerococcus]KAA9299624.1 tryptophan synthase subunit alpha [Aerococcus sanguinicola]MDK6369987.1 tryptophan synthase subunit alpha [Aerococcus sp. UMB9870]MDK6680539.1 tryptophan synthase subunit alpha [Aerococcus sp. UMB8608]MDK6687369.1 tryptophan synthase subunit alpha [Aerococcus sp. UMB8623]MDK6940510.1 tryptophan synthase subunit alpha [Aerococcus sp. UMB8487]